MVSEITFREALARAVRDEMAEDPNVFIFGLDVPDHKKIYGSTVGLLEEFGERRCFGTPLSEDAMTGVAIGAALSGLRPVHVHIRSDFLLLGLNQLANVASTVAYNSDGKLSVPLVIRAVTGRGWGQGAQHSKSMHSVFAHIPGLKMVMPTSPQDAYSLLRASIRDNNPVVFLEHRWAYDVKGNVDFSHQDRLGRASVLREGNDLTILAVSWMNYEALKAAEVLSKYGIEAEVVDVRSIMPLDGETILNSVRKTKRCLVADYDWTYCGLSAELSAMISKECFGDLLSPVERVGFAHAPCPTARHLENAYYPSAKTLIEIAQKMIPNSTVINLENEHFYSYEDRFKGPF